MVNTRREEPYVPMLALLTAFMHSVLQMKAPRQQIPRATEYFKYINGLISMCAAATANEMCHMVLVSCLGCSMALGAYFNEQPLHSHPIVPSAASVAL